MTTRYAKAVTAFFTALGTWGYAVMAADPNGVSSITGAEWFGLCGVVVTTAAVWGVPNERPAGEPYAADISEREPEAGHFDSTTVLLVVVAVIAVIALLVSTGVL